MAFIRRNYRKRGSRYKTKPRRAVARKAGSYIGPLRGTRGIARLRLAGRRYRQALTTNPFPNTKIVRHKYCDVVSLSAAGAGTLQFYQWRANSVYDFDYTGVGHQPLFHDQMAAQYKYYTVLRSKVIINISPGNGQERRWVLYPDDDVSYPSNRNTLEEQHWVRPCIKLDKRNGPLTLTAWYDAAKWNRTTFAGLMADDQHKTLVGGNPTSAVTKFFSLLCGPMLDTDSLDAINVHVTAYFTVIWREPVDHSGS